MMIEDKIDYYLIQEVQKGNPQAFNALMLKYQYRVYKIVSRYVREPSEVLDITQETFIKAYQGLHRFRGDSAFYTWLYRIAINTSKNFLITNGKHAQSLNYEDIETQRNTFTGSTKDENTPEDILISDETEGLVFEFIEHLPTELKNSVLLREIDGLSYEEIAKLMECPVGTVRSRLNRARKMINEQGFTSIRS